MYKYKREYVTRREEQEINTVLWGYIIIILIFLLFIVEMYSLFISKIMPYTGNIIFDWIKDDYYYSALFPAMIIVSIIFVYFNWMSLKFFRHN